MLELTLLLLRTAGSALRRRGYLLAENLVLRHQLAVLQRGPGRPRLRQTDRLFWVLVRKFWNGWQGALVLVQPATVVRWHRQAFKSYWTRISRRGRRGRPPVSREIRELILRMAKANPLWGAPRIHGELLKLGIEVSQSTVGRLIPRRGKPPSPSWRSFLDNHVPELASVDFFTIPTATFRVLFVLVVLRHDRRRVVHFNVTEHPTAEWTAQQVVEAFPWDTAPRYLLRDRDATYGVVFRRRVKGLGINEVLIAPRSPWQNPYVERLIGTLRRELLDHVVVLDENHLRRVLARYLKYYHGWRCHNSLEQDSPNGRMVQSAELGKVVEFPEAGGLHHHYERRAA